MSCDCGLAICAAVRADGPRRLAMQRFARALFYVCKAMGPPLACTCGWSRHDCFAEPRAWWAWFDAAAEACA